MSRHGFHPSQASRSSSRRRALIAARELRSRNSLEPRVLLSYTWITEVADTGNATTNGTELKKCPQWHYPSRRNRPSTRRHHRPLAANAHYAAAGFNPRPPHRRHRHRHHRIQRHIQQPRPPSRRAPVSVPPRPLICPRLRAPAATPRSSPRPPAPTITPFWASSSSRKPVPSPSAT